MGRVSRPFGIWSLLTSRVMGGMVANPDTMGAAAYEKMVDGDETISAAIRFISDSVVSQFGDYVNPNPEAQTFIETMWENCQDTLESYIRHACTARWAGWAVAEKVFGYNDKGQVVLDQIPGLSPIGLRACLDMNPDSRTYGRLSGVKQAVMQDPLLPPIPISRLVAYTEEPRWGSPYGISGMKSILDKWIAKKTLYLGWGRTLERYGVPLTILQDDNLDTLEEGIDGSPSATKSDNYLKLLQSLHDSGCAVIPKAAVLQFVEAKAAFGEDHERFQNHANKCLLRGLLIPALLFEPTDIGSFALGSKHFEIFLKSIHQIVKALQDVILKQIYKPLLLWNFGKNCPLGRFKVQLLQEESLELWSKIFFAMTNSGYMTPTKKEDANLVRTTFGASEVTEGMPAPIIGKGVTPGTDTPVEGLPVGETPDGQGKVAPAVPKPAPKAPAGPQGRPKKATILHLKRQLCEIQLALLELGEEAA